MIRHVNIFRNNRRMPFVFSTWDKFTPEKQQAIQKQAAATMHKMAEGTL